jgi:hypothetical protein
MLIGLHMIVEQIIDLRDDVRHKQTLHEQCDKVTEMLKVKGSPLNTAKEAYDKAKKALVAGKKKKKGETVATSEIYNLATAVNDTYRMWQWHLHATEGAKTAADELKSQLDESLRNCRMSVRPGSAVWFGKVRTTSELTVDNLNGEIGTNGDDTQTSHWSSGRCIGIGLDAELQPDAALATAELKSWSTLAVDDEVEEVILWSPHPLVHSSDGESKGENSVNSYKLKRGVRSRVWSGGCARFPPAKKFLDGLIGTGKEVRVNEGIMIRMTFDSDRINKVFGRKDMKDEVNGLNKNGKDEYYYFDFLPEHIQTKSDLRRTGRILGDRGNGKYEVLWEEHSARRKTNVVSRSDIVLTTSKNAGDSRMPETTRQWLQYCETAYLASVGLPNGWEAKKSADGRTYYIDHINKVTQWDPPSSPAYSTEPCSAAVHPRSCTDRVSRETKGEDLPTLHQSSRQDNMSSASFLRVTSLSDEKDKMIQTFHLSKHEEVNLGTGTGDASELRKYESDKYADHEWRSPLFWLMRGLRYHRNEIFKTKEQYLDLSRFVQWWLQALSGIDTIAGLEDDAKYATANLENDFPGKVDETLTDKNKNVIGGSPLYHALVDTSLAQVWRAIECKSIKRIKEVFSNFPGNEHQGAPPNADPLIQHLLHTRIGQGETWLRDRNKTKRYHQWCKSPQDGSITVLQRRKWYRVGESFMRGNAFHLAVLVGDPLIFDFLLSRLQECIFKSEESTRKVAAGMDGEKDNDGETKGETDCQNRVSPTTWGGASEDPPTSDEKSDDVMQAFIAHVSALAAAGGASSEAASAAGAAAAAAICTTGSVKNTRSRDSDICQIEEGTRHSITSSLYDAEIAQMCLNTLDAHGRSETRCAIGRYNVLQTAAAFAKHKKTPLLCGLLRHIEDMHSKQSKLVRRRDERRDS